MLIYKVTLTILGKNFSPTYFLSQIENDFIVFDRNEPDELIFENNDDKYEFGSLSILNNSIYCLKNEFYDYEKWYNEFFIRNKIFVDKCGVNQVVYGLEIYYSDFCSLELSCSDNHKPFLEYNYSIPINVYKLEEQEILEMLLESGTDYSIATNYDW
jgi:hypothetical protein